ncbi:hypothetical protein [Sphingomonas sp. LT1P40]|uniref:hypothetical protein n=1 Tax=Alteristakelama amylovorans TaxID=3096166 RepID=UPI002FC8AE9F
MGLTENLPSPSGSPRFRTADDLLHHRHFPAAIDSLIDGLASLYGNDLRLVRTLFEFQRAVTFMIAVGIDAMQREGDAELSVATLADAAALMGIGPVRVVRRFVDEWREDGLILADPMPDDRRRHRLRATERMLAIDREWLAAFHAPLLELAPNEPRFRAAVVRDPDYHHDYRYVSQQALALANRVMVENPPVDFFMHHTSGARLLAVLLQAARGNADGWTPAGFYSAAATRTATSRVQVRAVLHLARDRGLVELSDRVEGRVRVSPVLQTGFAKWAAHALLAVDLVSAFSIADAHRRRR